MIGGIKRQLNLSTVLSRVNDGFLSKIIYLR